MNNLAFLTYSHALDWFAQVTISAVVHAVINAFVFRLMRHLTLGQAAVLVVVVLGCLFLWARARDRRDW